MSLELSKEVLDFMKEMSDEQFQKIKKISQSLPPEIHIQMPTTLPMDFVECDGVGTVKPMPLALEHDVDVEKDDKVKAPPLVDVIANTRDQIIRELEERESRARQRKEMVERRTREELEEQNYLEYENTVVFGNKANVRKTVENDIFKVPSVDDRYRWKKLKLMKEIRKVDSQMSFMEDQNRWQASRKKSSIKPASIQKKKNEVKEFEDVDIFANVRKMIENVPEAVSPIHTPPPTENNKKSSRKSSKKKKSKEDKSERKKSGSSAEGSCGEKNDFIAGVVDTESQGVPALYVTCHGATDQNRHECDYILHFDQDTDDSKVVRDPQTKEGIGYAWTLRNWDSLGSCRKVEQYLNSISFKGYNLIAQQIYEEEVSKKQKKKSKKGPPTGGGVKSSN